jgi:hypothetical protein
MISLSVIVVRTLGIMVAVALLVDLLRSPVNWQIVVVRFIICIPLLIPWSLLKKKWSQSLIYSLLWADLLLSFILVTSYFAFVEIVGSDTPPPSLPKAGAAVFISCASTLFFMRRAFVNYQKELNQALEPTPMTVTDPAAQAPRQP